MKRGEVWWGSPALPGDSRKRRPVLVVSADVFNLNELHPKVMVVHLTSAKRSRSYAWEVALPRGCAGLPSASIVKCSEVYTLLKEHLVQLAGTLPQPYLERVDEALCIGLGLALRL